MSFLFISVWQRMDVSKKLNVHQVGQTGYEFIVNLYDKKLENDKRKIMKSRTWQLQQNFPVYPNIYQTNEN